MASFSFEVILNTEAMQRGVASTKEIIDGVLEGMPISNGEKVLVVDLLSNRPTNCLFFIQQIQHLVCLFFIDAILVFDSMFTHVLNTLEVQ